MIRSIRQTVQAAMHTALPEGAVQPDLTPRSLSAAGRFSRKDGTPVLTSGEQVSVYPVEGWQKVVMPGPGSAADQARNIANQITALAIGQADLADLVDGRWSMVDGR